MRKILPMLLVACLAMPTVAAEVRVLSEAGCSGPLVLLGDVAEIHASEEARRAELAAVELFPAPPAGAARQLTLRELQELLYLRGIDVSDCHFFGASTTSIVAGAAEPGALPVQASGATVRLEAEKRLSQAIVSYLEVMASDEGSDIEWEVELNVAQQYAALIAQEGTEIVVRGGESPWRGRQSFIITLLAGIGSAEVGAQEYTIDVNVHAMKQVIVASQSLSRGRQVGPSDVRLVSYEADVVSEGLLVSPEEAVGLELATSVTAGRPIRAADLRAPRLVLRNDQVTLVARREGVVVRTAARAMGDGAQGELIEVQAFPSRTRFMAFVVAPGVVELSGPSGR